MHERRIAAVRDRRAGLGTVSGVSVVLLCEDRQTDSFVRRFLKRRNFRHRDIRTLPFPHGHGAGEQSVRDQYPGQLQAIRGRQGAFLIVVADADGLSTADRRARLDAECNQKNVQVRTAADPVIMAVPRRNIETWLAYLDGIEVDETESYPKLQREGDCQRHAERLFTMCHDEQQLAEPAPQSLVEACEEYAKLQR